MEKLLGQDLNPRERVQFLTDNADAVEELGYNKPLTQDEITNLKEELTNNSIRISDILEKKAAAAAEFNEQLKPLEKSRKEAIAMLKNRSEFRTEGCFKFIDHESGEVGFYNSDGVLVYQRGILPGERQKTIFENMDFRKRKTGTNN